MSFTVESRGRVADILRDGDTYRVQCRQCGSSPETTDRGQARREAEYHNAPGSHGRSSSAVVS